MKSMVENRTAGSSRLVRGFLALAPLLGTADPSRAAVVLGYCGYIGGDLDDEVGGVAVDMAGRLYVAGVTIVTMASCHKSAQTEPSWTTADTSAELRTTRVMESPWIPAQAPTSVV